MAATTRESRICIRDSIWRGIARIADALLQEAHHKTQRTRRRRRGARRIGTRASARYALPAAGSIVLCVSVAVWLCGLLFPSADELVSQSVDGEDVLGRLGIELDLLSQARDVDINGARQRRLVIAPDFRQQRLA